MGKAYQLTDADRHRLGLAVHEAAHAVFGVLYGATVTRAVLTEDGSEGLCEFSEDSFTTDRDRRRRALVAAAGPTAQAVFHHGQRVTLRQVEGQLGDADREELRLAAFSSLANVQEQLWDVLPTVQRHWRSIGTLATKIYAGHDVEHGDVLAALGVTNDDRAARQLEMIRNRVSVGSSR